MFKVIALGFGACLAILGIEFIAFMKCVVIGAVLAQNGDDAFFIVA